MFDPVDVFYMDKLVCGSVGIGAVDIRRPVEENLSALAAARDVSVSGLTVVVLDKPRHVGLIRDIRNAGATVRLVREGDVAGAVEAATEGSGIDLVICIGGTPEGVIAACAVRALGGFMQARLAPQNEEQVLAALAAGHDLTRVLELSDLVASNEVVFVSTDV
jgi:fructose-1,6-bisphosphatase II